jgi:hypothetical protein
MDNQRPILERGYRHDLAQQRALDFEQLLRDHGLEIRPGSLLEGAVLDVLNIVYRRGGVGPVDVTEDLRITYRSLIGVNELAGLVLQVRNHSNFGELLPHLRLLNEGAALQNAPAEQRDDSTRKLFELFAATLAMQCGSDVCLDHPKQSAGDNPDVLATIGNQRWGIACKVIQSLNPEGFIQHLEKGIDQIEKSSAEVGVVLFNLMSVLDYEALWPVKKPANPKTNEEAELVCFTDPSVPYNLLLRQAQLIGARLKGYLPNGYLESVFQQKKTIPGFILWAHATTAVLMDGKPTPSSLRVMNLQTAKPVDSSHRRVLECLNWAAFPDAERGPRPD